MTQPRLVLPGRTYMVIRVVSGRRFGLKPERWMAELFSYALARACEATGVVVLAGSAPSNHYHLVVHDERGQLPRFMQMLDGTVARAANAERGERDHFWSSEGAVCVPLEGKEAVEEAMTYSICNPVEHGLVARAVAWQGFVTRPRDLASGARSVERPRIRFYSRRSRSPDTAALVLALPPTHDHLTPDAFRRLMQKRVSAREAEIAKARGGASFLGMEAVLAVSHADRPTDEPPLFTPKPIAKAGRVEHAREVFEAQRTLLRTFRTAYRLALELVRAGQRAIFPHGTWRMVAELGHPVDEPTALLLAAT